MNNQYERILWTGFLNGDKNSYEKIITCHFKILFNYGHKFSTHSELIEDCIQELFIKLWSSRMTLNKEVNTKAYLMASFRRMLNRKIKTESRLPLTDSYDEEMLSFNMEVSVEERIIENEKVKLLSNAFASILQNLPARQKEVVYLKFFQDMSRDEIATAMGISRQTVSNQLQLALRKMKTEIGPVPNLMILFSMTRIA